tara:strand:- start:46261 stop:46488 length:228 start_codon:yes stop_codon:yes gene_type:complete
MSNTHSKFLSEKTRHAQEVARLRKGRDGLQVRLNQIETYLRTHADGIDRPGYPANAELVMLKRFFPGSHPIIQRG